jgi:hypothetical protein
MKIKCIVILGLTTFGLMAFAGCGGDDSADKTARTPPPETTAAGRVLAAQVRMLTLKLDDGSEHTAEFLLR